MLPTFPEGRKGVSCILHPMIFRILQSLLKLFMDSLCRHGICVHRGRHFGKRNQERDSTR